MSLDYEAHLLDFMYFFMLGMFIYIPIVMIGILVMHFLMPKAVLAKYFKPPYFRESECLFFTGIPYAPIRTVMFIRAIASPASGKVRGVTEAHLLVPAWYRFAAKVMAIALYIMAVSLLVFLVGGGIIYFADQP